jgi:alkylresorcinol/alkylpyrone synthase
MGWRVEEDGFGVLFSRDIPSIVHDRYGAAVDGFLTCQNLTRADLDGVLCHPGGAKVIDALEKVFGLAPGDMADSREVLRAYGNMSAATVMFVLDRALRQGVRGRQLLSSLGPGFTAAFALLEAP